jgi:hypothetical protein
MKLRYGLLAAATVALVLIGGAAVFTGGLKQRNAGKRRESGQAERQQPRWHDR